MAGASVVSGAVVGLGVGVAARLAMRLLFLLNPGTKGLLVGEMFPVGEVTAHGTLLILIQGAVLGGIAGLMYELARPSLPRSPTWAGLVFGGWLTVALLGLLVVGEARDFDLFGPFPVAAGVFGIIFVAFGLVLAQAVGRIGDALPLPGWLRRGTTWLLLGLTGAFGLVVFAQEALARI